MTHKLRWWQCGVVGLWVLLVTTVVGVPLKILVYRIRHSEAEIPWHELPHLVLFVSTAGFLCGAVVWLLLPLSKKFGTLGDALGGLVTMCFFFLLCMLIFDPSLLIPDPTRGLPMWAIAVSLGIVLGVWCGKDHRRLLSEQREEQAEAEQKCRQTERDECGD